MTVLSQARYELAAARNVGNLVDRFWGTNKGTLETRTNYVSRFKSAGISTIEKVKKFVGVRESDVRFDTALGKIASDVDAALTAEDRKKKPEAKKEAAPVEKTVTQKIKDLLDAAPAAQEVKKVKKKGPKAPRTV